MGRGLRPSNITVRAAGITVRAAGITVRAADRRKVVLLVIPSGNLIELRTLNGATVNYEGHGIYRHTWTREQYTGPHLD